MLILFFPVQNSHTYIDNLGSRMGKFEKLFLGSIIVVLVIGRMTRSDRKTAWLGQVSGGWQGITGQAQHRVQIAVTHSHFCLLYSHSTWPSESQPRFAWCRDSEVGRTSVEAMDHQVSQGSGLQELH